MSNRLKRWLAATAISAMAVSVTACGADADPVTYDEPAESGIPKGTVLSEEEFGFGWVTAVQVADGTVCYVASDNRGISITCPPKDEF